MMTTANEEGIRNAVTAAMSSLSASELRELVMAPYEEFQTVKVLAAA